MPIEMTERLEEALEEWGDHYDTAGLSLYEQERKAELTLKLLAALREARDAPKTKRFEVGQRVRYTGVSEDMTGTVVQLCCSVKTDGGSTGLYANKVLEPIPAPSEEQGEPITIAHEGVRIKAHYETALTVERLVRVLRGMDAKQNANKDPFVQLGENLGVGLGGRATQDYTALADALEAEEE